MIQLPSFKSNNSEDIESIELKYNNFLWIVDYRFEYELAKNGISSVEVDADITITEVYLELNKEWIKQSEISFETYSFMYGEIKTKVLGKDFDFDKLGSDCDENPLLDTYYKSIIEDHSI